jgi:hypothetical protein
MTDDSMTARTAGWDARTTSATEPRTLAASGRYVLGRDAKLRDTRTGLVVGPWSDAVKRAGALRPARR